jgi:hypothetical protein
MMKKSFWMTSGVMLLGCGLCLAQSEQPSLGELAKENKTAHKAGKTFTEADLTSTRTNATEAVTAAPAAASDERTGSTASNEKKDNAKETGPAGKDRPAVTELTKQAESYRQERDTWKSSAKRYEALLANETNDFRRQMYQDAIENDKKNIAFYQQKLDQAQSELVNAQKPVSSGSSGGAGVSQH